MTKTEIAKNAWLREEAEFRAAEKARRLVKAISFAKNNPEVSCEEIAKRFNIHKDKLTGVRT
jgi:hypothetical protein